MLAAKHESELLRLCYTDVGTDICIKDIMTTNLPWGLFEVPLRSLEV